MKFIKWKILIATSIVCLLPILPGVILWEMLPDSMAIHFNIYNQPDNFASKAFAVFGLPFMMMCLQVINCFIFDINAKKHGDRKKFERVTKWIIPIMCIIIQIATLMYGIGVNVDSRRIAMLIVGGVLLFIGNYMPKFDYIKDYDVDKEKARKIHRFIGYETVVMGVLHIISVFLPPIASVICLFLFIPYVIIAVAYGIKHGKKQ